MSERVVRETDEKLYQPAIHSARIRELYIIKRMTGIPMTVLVDTALREFIAFYVSDPQYKEFENLEIILGDRHEEELHAREFEETDN